MLKQVEGSHSTAEAIALCRPEVICAYPITPQTHIVEGLGEMVKTGDLKNCEFINVESEFAALSVAIGAYASNHFGTLLPLAGVSLGIVFCTLYGLEKWKFHQVWFGALGMGAIAMFSYLAQTVITGQAPDAAVALMLLGAGFAYSYVLLGLYEHTKRDGSTVIWRILGGQFVLSYILGLAILWFR